MRQNRQNYERTMPPGAGAAVEDYTTPFLWSAGMLCFVVLFAIFSVFGMLLTLVLAYMTDRLFLRR